MWSLAYPDREVKFAMDKDVAAATRKRVLGMLSADKYRLSGTIRLFPAWSYVAPRSEDGYQYVPASYQMVLG